MSSGLLDRVVELAGALREVGVPVSLAESLDAVRAMGAVDLLDRAALRAAFAATMVKRLTHRPAFDDLFDLYFPRATGPSATVGAATAAAGGEPDPATMRDALRRILLDGDDDELRRFAIVAVAALGRAEAPPGRQSYFSHRVLQALSPRTLLASLLAAALGADRGGFAEEVARRTFAERLARFEGHVDAEVRRGLAEERGAEAVARTAIRGLPEHVDFVRANATDLAELRRTVLPLARRLATRLAARRRSGRHARLDFRRTVRASLGTGGVPVVTHGRGRRPHRPELVVLCDVSGSVSGFARFTLMLAYALREQFARVRAFAFVDTCDEVTGFFATGDFAEAAYRLAADARVVRYDGHSDYGRSFEDFAERYGGAVTSRTSLLILGDARNNHRALGLGALGPLVRQARHSYWLNPEPRQFWDTGDSAVSAYAEVVDEMVEVRNAEQLSRFVARLLPAG